MTARSAELRRAASITRSVCDAGLERAPAAGSPVADRPLHPLVELDVAARLGLRRARRASSVPSSRPTPRAGPRRSPGRAGSRRARSASSCTSRPHFTYAALVPERPEARPRLRGQHRLPTGASGRRTRARARGRSRRPPARPGAASRTSAYTERAGPSSSSAWSIRCGPRSNSTPPASSGVAALAPLAAVDLGPPALEARLEPQQLAERAVRDEPAQREEVAVPAAVVEHARDDTALAPRPPRAAGRPRRSRRAACPPRRAARPRSPRARAAACVRLGAATTTRSCSPAAAKQLVGRGHDVGVGMRASAPASARSWFDVTIDVSASPGTASTSGAWNADPARPYPISPTRSGVRPVPPPASGCARSRR